MPIKTGKAPGPTAYPMNLKNRRSMPALLSNLTGRLCSPTGVSLLLGAVAFAGVLALWRLGVLQPLELAVYDFCLRLRPVAAPDSRIILIGETEADLQRFGHPLSDDLLAQSLERLLQAQPRVIGVDKYRDIPVPPGTDRLTQLLARQPNIIWVMKFGFAGAADPPVAPPSVLQGSERSGFSDVAVDSDGVVRRGLLFLDDGRQTYASFPLAVALRYLGQEGITPQPDSDDVALLRLGRTSIPPFESDTGGYVNADAGGYQFLLDYRDAPGRLPIYTLADLLDGRIPPQALRDKIVLLGSMAVSLRDQFCTPLNCAHSSPQLLYGVEVQASILSQLLRFALDGATPVRSLSEWQEMLWLGGWCLVGIWLGLRQLSLISLVGYTLLTGSVLTVTAYAALSFGWWLPLASAWLGGLLTAASSAAYVSIHERTEKRIAMQLFSNYVSAEVADTIWQSRAQWLEGGRLRSQRLSATVLFTDIEGFTTIAETLPPTDLLEWLNTYLDAMTQVVTAHGGVVNKYIGDAVMALFGVPVPRAGETEIAQDAVQAVRCALAMGAELERLNAQWQVQGLPTIAMRIGIHTGPLVAGSLGSSRRLEYTVIGDTVNIASRLEAFQKEDKVGAAGVCRISIGETTRRYLGEQFRLESVGLATLKGKKEQIVVYRVLDVCR
ncbi:MAG: adenylate/guanylate cyclase domain-containing protein [Candidatus Competibacteraceae bacterium]